MELHIEESGNKKKPTVIFLHAIATSSWMWRETISHLKDFHCITVDLPGHGQSAHIIWESLPKAAEELNIIIKSNTTNSKVHLVGLSFGSYVGVQYISMFPNSVESAVFSGLNILPLPNKWLMNVLGVFILPLVKTNIFIKQNAATLKIPAKHYEGYKISVLQLHKRSFYKASKELLNYQIPDAIKTTPCRILFTAGELEHPLILQSLERLSHIISNATRCIVPGVGHGWSGEKPELFADTVRAWITNKELPY